MAFNVQILCPNGRRQNIKSNFNATLLQILEDCCKKQGFLPPEDYSLMHGRTMLDLTLSIRYLNLTNNAKLELVKAATPRKESEILVALQLSEGTRLQKSFLPKVTLWDILQYWWMEADSSLQPFLTTEVDLSNSPCVHPICIYMREEIVGEVALKNTPLRKLGLTGGKAVLRLVHREIDDATYSKIIQKIDIETTKKMKLDEIAARHLKEEKTEKLTETVRDVAESSSDNMMEISQETPNPVSETQPTVLPNVQFSEYGENLTSQQEVMQHDQQTEFKQQQQKLQERNVADVRLVHRDIDDATNTEIKQKMDTETTKKMKLDEIAASHLIEEKTKKEIETGRDVGESSSDNMMEISQETPNPVLEKPPKVVRRVHFSEHRENITSQQEVMQRDQQTEFKLQQQQQKLQERNFAEVSLKESDNFKMPERNILISNKCVNQKENTKYEDPPDEFYEVTKSDLMNMMADLHKRLRDVDDVPLLTKSAKEAKMFEKYAKYKTATIRIHFPDSFILQGTFHPQEDVASLYQFVRDNLEDSNMAFYLYISPPKQVLKNMTENLISARLVPASVVFFGSKSNKAHFLKPDLLAQVISKEDIDNCFVYSGTNDAKETILEESPRASTSQEKPSTSKASSTLRSSESQNSKNFVPKWFKMGHK